MFNGETGRGRIGCESATPNVLHSDRRKNTQDKQFFPLFSEFMENLQNLIKIGRVGGNTSDRPGRVGISCFSLLCTAIPSPYVFQTIINLAVTNTSCFLGTDISKQHHCVVLLLHFTRILWLFLVVACPHTFFFLFILQGYMSRHVTFYCYSISGDDVE